MDIRKDNTIGVILTASSVFPKRDVVKKFAYATIGGFEGIIEHRVLPIRWRGEVIREFHIYKLKNYKHTIREERMFEGY